MKKILVLLAMIGISIATLCSCGSKSVKGADGTEYSSYQEACRHQDFVAAYDWIEKNNGSDDDKDYVFNAEMLYLTSLGTEEASNRIVYLLAEYQIPGTPVKWGVEYHNGKQREDAEKYVAGLAKFNQRCDNVIDMAIAQGNESLARKIVGFYKEEFRFEEAPSEEYVFVFQPNWHSKEAAIEKISEAF